MKKKEIIPFVIYVFDDNQVIYAASRVKLTDGFDEVYGSGFALVQDDNKDDRLNDPTKIRSRARRSVINEVSNVLNAFNLYGRSILDEKGQVSWEKVKDLEYLAAQAAVKYSVSIKDLKKLHIFKVIEIDYKTAEQYNLV